mmetsp:Transcript_18160/g.42444  ORF Transcript_18160/g.42444 Transcript_18160/m.42444 type:complete len:594 (-) Transcript_18160:4-1785(-)
MESASSPMASCIAGVCIDRRTKALQDARMVCLGLEALAAKGEAVPVANVRAAISNLELLERWTQRQPRKWNLAEVFGASPGDRSAINFWRAASRLDHPASPEVQATFVEHFGNLEANEELEEDIPCSAESYSFYHPGQLYLSTARLCFCSQSIFGLHTKFAVPWTEVVRIRASTHDDQKDAAGDEKVDAAGDTFIRVSLKNFIMFDGEKLDSIKLMVHNHLAVARLHSAGSAAAVGVEFEEVEGEAGVSEASALEDALRRFEKKVKVWEVQRRYTIWNEEWHTPFLPHDGDKKWRWMMLERGYYIRHPRLPTSLTLDDMETDQPPIASMKFLGRNRTCRWTPEVSDLTDADGWQYAVDFSASWSKAPASFSHVRRRCWRPVFSADEMKKQEAVPVLKPSMTVSITTVEHLKPSMIYESDVGEISLQALAKQFKADDWMAAGTLMAVNFASLGMKAVELGAWKTPLDDPKDEMLVQGEVRSAQYIAPVPKAPMCPPETRAKATYHVAATDNEVVLESMTQTLDVPYGDYFFLYVTDRFTRDTDSNRTHMQRSWAIRWVKSTWMQNMVESNIPGQLVTDADRFHEVLTSWAASQG